MKRTAARNDQHGCIEVPRQWAVRLAFPYGCVSVEPDFGAIETDCAYGRCYYWSVVGLSGNLFTGSSIP